MNTSYVPAPITLRDTITYAIRITLVFTNHSNEDLCMHLETYNVRETNVDIEVISTNISFTEYNVCYNTSVYHNKK